uniref:Uncharacterized protein n=1 Tax=Utricularia reniformis TaxID=192314 RepID=A0A1Y0B183_9LAMI|nr:hypothetical protein AEK19_MT0979 [Utricularia reniformis]ART31202.1 hypothetical protein AEK19_MT0979 [Utricularia reniformis]
MSNQAAPCRIHTRPNVFPKPNKGYLLLTAHGNIRPIRRSRIFLIYFFFYSADFWTVDEIESDSF